MKILPKTHLKQLDFYLAKLRLDRYFESGNKENQQYFQIVGIKNQAAFRLLFLLLSSFHGAGNFLSDERYGQSGETRTACRYTLLIPHTKNPAYWHFACFSVFWGLLSHLFPLTADKILLSEWPCYQNLYPAVWVLKVHQHASHTSIKFKMLDRNMACLLLLQWISDITLSSKKAFPLLSLSQAVRLWQRDCSLIRRTAPHD